MEDIEDALEESSFRDAQSKKANINNSNNHSMKRVVTNGLLRKAFETMRFV